MVSYTFTNYNEGNLLIPKNAMLTEEYLMDHGRLFMTEIPVKDDWGRTYRRYRLKSGEAMRWFSGSTRQRKNWMRCRRRLQRSRHSDR